MAVIDEIEKLHSELLSQAVVIDALKKDGISEEKAQKILEEAQKLANDDSSEYSIHCYSVCYVAPLGCIGVNREESCCGKRDKKTSGDIYKKLQQFVSLSWNVTYLRDSLKCKYCGFDGLTDLHSYYSMTVDHIIPRNPRKDHQDIWTQNHAPYWEHIMRANEIHNLACSCRNCNSLKSNKAEGFTQESLSSSRTERLQHVEKEKFIVPKRDWVKLRRERFGTIKNLVDEINK